MIIFDIKGENNFACDKIREKYRKMSIVEYTKNSYDNTFQNRKLIIRYYFFFGRAIIT